MTIEDVLQRLDRVRKSGRGWMARCPAHEDRSPSLSVRVADDGKLLLHDFGGCRLEDILSTLRLRPVDLFPEQDHDPHQWRESQRRRDAERARQAREWRITSLRADVLREAERVIRSARGLNIRTLTDAQLHTVLNRVGDAYNVLFESEIIDGTSGIL
jgi:hypothetical protein